MEQDIRIAELNRYPLKSGRRQSASSYDICDSGIWLDRSFVIIRDDVAEGRDNFLSQRYTRGEELVHFGIDHDRHLQDRFLKFFKSNISIELDTSLQKRQRVCIHGRETSGLDCGDQVAETLSDYFGFQVRMVCADKYSLNPVDPQFSDYGRVAFGD